MLTFTRIFFVIQMALSKPVADPGGGRARCTPPSPFAPKGGLTPPLISLHPTFVLKNLSKSSTYIGFVGPKRPCRFFGVPLFWVVVYAPHLVKSLIRLCKQFDYNIFESIRYWNTLDIEYYAVFSNFVGTFYSCSCIWICSHYVAFKYTDMPHWSALKRIFKCF